VDVATFTDPAAYRRDVDALIGAIKGLPPAEGFAEVLVPGEVENRVREERLAAGIPLPEGTVRNLREVAKELGVACPV